MTSFRNSRFFSKRNSYARTNMPMAGVTNAHICCITILFIVEACYIFLIILRSLYNRRIFSSSSAVVLHSMQRVVTGRASNRLNSMGSPQTSQKPNEPSSILSKALRILFISFLSLSRMRNSKLRSDSRAARSVGSGNELLDSISVISSTVLPAPRTKSSSCFCSIPWKYSKSSFFIFISKSSNACVREKTRRQTILCTDPVLRRAFFKHRNR